MIRRLVLVLMFVFALLAALPAATSADHGEAHGGRDCFTYEETGYAEGCISGGRGEGGYGGRYDYEVTRFQSTSDVSISGGGGQGGAGGHLCFTDLGEQECYIGGVGEGGQGGRTCYTSEELELAGCYSGGFGQGGGSN